MIIAPWGLTIKPGATYKYEIPPFANLKISNAALGVVLEDEHSRTTLTIETEEQPPADSEDEEESDEEKPQLTNIVLTSLTPGKIEQSIHDITFSFPALLKIKAIGKNTIHLGGNLIAEPETDESDSEADYLLDEEVGELDELNSDIEIHPDHIEIDDASTDGDRFEQLDDAPQAKAGQKRPREDDMDEDEDEDEVKQATLTKSQKKKLNKKLKAQNGEAVPVGAPSTDKKGTEKEKQERGPESSPEASKKEGKEKKEHKKEEKEKKKEEKKEKKEKKKEQTNGAPTASTSVDPLPNKKTLAGGLVIEDSKVGTGKTAKAGSLCSMRYIGKLTNGTTFDSNTKGKAFTFKLGSGQVIKGWDQGIVGMQEGGERMLTVPPALAYGNRKMSGIPPNSTLQFEVKLLSIK